MATPSRICPGCGREAPADARFCPACGARLGDAAARDERKVVSVVFVDLVGYAERTERLDPEDTRALLATYWQQVRRELERFGGTVEKFIGDAVVGLFGAPLVHEDDAERAVRAALSIRDWARGRSDLVVRIAVATGPALVRLGARVAEGEGMVVGDVVTTASRLQEQAPPGCAVVDRRTHRATDAAPIAYRSLAALRVKGRRAPVGVWEALAVTGPPGLHPLAPTPFVGRRPELDLVLAELARVRTSATTQLVTVVGAPGVGKTRLVLEVEAASGAGPEPPDWWKGRALPYGDGVAYWALGEGVKSRAGIHGEDGVGPARQKLARLLAALLPDPSERGRVEPHVQRLAGVAVDGRPGEDDRLDTFAAWRRLLEAATDERPLVLVLEDVHWADDGLLDFVEYLVEWATHVPLLVLCTARPELFERRPAWGGGRPNALTLSLVPLSDDETVTLLESFLGGAPPPELLPGLLARVGGNPLYAEQYARMLLERVADRAELPLPESVQGIIAARLDGLLPEEKLVLQDAAVAGRSFSADVVAAIGDRSAEDVASALHRLERKDLVRRAAAGGDDVEYVFAHRLVRDVAYEEIARAARADKHLRAATRLEERGRPDDTAELVAHQYREALACGAVGGPGDGLAERARRAFARAGDRALGLDAFGAAARYYMQALELWPPGDLDRARVLLRLGRAQSVSEGGGEGVLLEARDALLAAGDSDSAGEAEALLSEIRWYRGDRAGAKEHLDRAVELVQDSPSSHAKAWVLARLARALMLAADYPASIAAGTEAQALAEQLGLDTLVADALNSIGSARVRGGDLDGIADVRRAIDLAPHTHTAVVALNNLSALYADIGEREQELACACDARRRAQELGDRSFLDWSRAAEVLLAWSDGRLDDALAAADSFLASRRGRPHYLDSSVHLGRALVFQARDDIAAALEEAAAAEQAARTAADPQVVLPTLVECACIELFDGSIERAEALAGEVLDLSEETGYLPPDTSLGLAFVFIRCGRVAELAEVLERVRLPSRWFDAARACVAGDMAAAVAICDAIGEPWASAWVRLLAAESLVEAGRYDDARTQVEPAIAFYRSVGATRWLREAERVAGAVAPA